MNMKPIVGTTIIVYGQEAIITEIVNIDENGRIYLNHSIVVPSIEYTRDYIYVDEIQKHLNL